MDKWEELKKQLKSELEIGRKSAKAAARSEEYAEASALKSECCTLEFVLDSLMVRIEDAEKNNS
jgi:hypothetical protein